MSLETSNPSLTIHIIHGIVAEVYYLKSTLLARSFIPFLNLVILFDILRVMNLIYLQIYQLPGETIPHLNPLIEIYAQAYFMSTDIEVITICIL